MNGIRPYYLTFLILIPLLTGCGDELIQPQPRIPDEFKSFIVDFAEEAKTRNVSVDTSKIEVVYVDRIRVEGRDFCGRGLFNYQGTGTNRIEISLQEGCWSGRSDLEKENLFFHELGHAVLGRFHLNDLLPNGTFKSLMCGNCSNFGTYTKYTLFKRPYYLDELFDPAASVPDWGTNKTVKATILDDGFNDGPLEWTFVTTDGAVNRNNYSGSVVADRFHSDPNSLRISAEKIEDTDASAFWRLTIPNPEIPAYANLFLTCQVRSESLQGIGASISIAGFRDSQGSSDMVFHDTTFGRNNILGSLPFTPYHLNYHCYPEQVDRLEIYFEIQPNTIGQVYLDNVELIINK